MQERDDCRIRELKHPIRNGRLRKKWKQKQKKYNKHHFFFLNECNAFLNEANDFS